FFSSRRRHTRWPRDWSSDVCSSDLGGSAHARLPDIVYLHIGSLNAASLAMHRRLRARPATEHVPILLVSDPLAKKELAFRLKLGIHDFLISSDLVRSEPFWDELNADSQRRGEQALI